MSAGKRKTERKRKEEEKRKQKRVKECRDATIDAEEKTREFMLYYYISILLLYILHILYILLLCSTIFLIDLT